MGKTEAWLEEYEKKLKDGMIQLAETELNTVFEKLLDQEKVILTSRIKTVKSLKEKIKRNRLDNEENKNKGIFEILEDQIGIRIVCKKMCDEKRINDILIGSKIELKNNNYIEFLEDLTKQPGLQKNGHSIYKVKCTYKNNIKFELQIKSLSNLFWGEMEHPLIYKNNKYLVKGSYYKKEMESIYNELNIIDDKLEYMESVMMDEDELSLLEEKKDIIRRILYLNLKEKFYEIHDEYLNNNHIFEGVSNFVFKPYKTKRGDSKDVAVNYYNMQMLNCLNLILNSEKMKLSLKQFTTDILNEFEIDKNEVNYSIVASIKNLDSGWWYFIVIVALIEYNNKYPDNFDSLKLTTNEIKCELEDAIKNILFIINAKIINPLISLYKHQDDDISHIKYIVECFKVNLVMTMSDARYLGFTDETNSENISEVSGNIIRYLRDNTNKEGVIIEGNEIYFQKIVDNIIKCTISSTNINSNIKPYLTSINQMMQEITGIPLPISMELLEFSTVITSKDLKIYFQRGDN
jgi:ppGpp synthetase/RelA/SpoT-type nucleotidyltranferase